MLTSSMMRYWRLNHRSTIFLLTLPALPSFFNPIALCRVRPPIFTTAEPVVAVIKSSSDIPRTSNHLQIALMTRLLPVPPSPKRPIKSWGLESATLIEGLAASCRRFPEYSILDRQRPHHTESNQPLQTLHYTNLCDMATEWMLVDDLEIPFFLWGTQITSYGQARDMVQGNAPGLIDSFDALFRTILCVI